MALDGFGRPHIAYRDGFGNLYYARWTGSKWQISSVDKDLDGGRVANLGIGIAVDKAGRAHISYYDNGSGYDGRCDLKYARWTGSSWSIQRLMSDHDAGEYNSIALDNKGWPHICFYYQSLPNDSVSFGKLQYIHWNGSGWLMETVDDPGKVGPYGQGDAGEYCKIAVDSSGNPRVVYAAWTDINYDYNWHTRYAVRSRGGGWSVEAVNDHRGLGAPESDFALGPGDTPHIAYTDKFTDNSKNALHYARKSGVTWSIQTVDSAFNAGLWVSLSVDGLNSPYLTYTDGYYNMTHARLKSGAWIKAKIASSVTSIASAVASPDNPRVAFYAGNNPSYYVLKYTIGYLAPGPTVISPNGGEVWKRGTSHKITWTSPLKTGTLAIKLYKGTALKNAISGNVSCAGSYDWTIPLSLDAGKNYKVKILWNSKPSLFDFSDREFTIY
jgi:hypothetical protein